MNNHKQKWAFAEILTLPLPIYILSTQASGSLVLLPGHLVTIQMTSVISEALPHSPGDHDVLHTATHHVKYWGDLGECWFMEGK